MQITVVGAGAIGSYYAACLARSGEEVTLVARGEHLRAIRARGLRIASESGEDFEVHLPLVARPEDAGSADLVLLCVKSYDLEEAAGSLGPLLGNDTLVLTLQNGVEHGERLAAVIGEARTLHGATYIVAHRVAPGLIEHTSGGRIEFGPLAGPPTPAAIGVQETLRRGGIDAEAVEEIALALWRKYIGILAFGSVNCLTRAPAVAWQDLPETRALVRAIAEEAQAVAEARGVRIGAEGAERVMQLLPELPPSYSTSMLADLLAGNRLELETLQGALVRLGRELGVPTPHAFTVYAALRPFRDGAPSEIASNQGTATPRRQ
jgi:2-dehydropantoate 2-reductase